MRDLNRSDEHEEPEEPEEPVCGSVLRQSGEGPGPAPTAPPCPPWPRPVPHGPAPHRWVHAAAKPPGLGGVAGLPRGAGTGSGLFLTGLLPPTF